MPDPSSLLLPNPACLAEGAVPGKVQKNPRLFGLRGSRAKPGWKEPQEASGTHLLLLPPLFTYLFNFFFFFFFGTVDCVWVFSTSVPGFSPPSPSVA